MKNIILAILFSTLGLNTVFAQNPKSETLITINKGDLFIAGESSSGMICTNDESCITVYNEVSQNYYVYHNGVKNGPYNKNQIAQYMCKKDILEKPNEEIFNDEFEEDNQFEFNDDGKAIFNFKGKQYGPYLNIVNLYLSDSKDSFVGTGIIDDMSAQIFSNLCSPFAVEGYVEKITINENGNKFLVTMKTISEIDAIINKKMMNLEGSNLSEDQAFKMMQEITDLQENASEDAKTAKAFIYTENGQKFGPYPAPQLYDSNPAFANKNQNNWTMILGSKLYINGAEIKDFGEAIYQNDKVFLSADGKQYAVLFYDKIILTDGTQYPYPVYAGFCGNTFIWLCLVNETKLVKYSLAF